MTPAGPARWTGAAVVALLLVAGTACGSDGSGAAPAAGGSAPGPGVTGRTATSQTGTGSTPTATTSPRRTAGSPAAGATSPASPTVPRGAPRPTPTSRATGSAPAATASRTASPADAPPSAPETSGATPSAAVGQTVPPKPVVTRKPVRLDQPADAGGRVDVRITRVRAIQAKAQLPGEVAGPGVALTVVVENGSRRVLDLDAVVVTLADSARAPGIAMSAAPAHPFSGTLASGRTTTGVYVFTVGRTRRNPVSVDVTLAGEAPVLLFTGDAT